MMRQHAFLTRAVLDMLDRKPQQVINSLRQLQTLLTKPGNLRVHVAANVAKLAARLAPQAPWKSFIPKDRRDEDR